MASTVIFISHRGNTTGALPYNENNPNYIDSAIFEGFDVEVDLRSKSGSLFFGHDFPQYLVNEEWIDKRKNNLWIHCKDSVSLEYCIDNNLHCFFHQSDEYTLTSKGFVWGYPGTTRSSNKGILVLPEKRIQNKEVSMIGYYGICSDYVYRIKNDSYIPQDIM